MIRLFLSEHLLFNKITVFRQEVLLSVKLLPFDSQKAHHMKNSPITFSKVLSGRSKRMDYMSYGIASESLAG